MASRFANIGRLSWLSILFLCVVVESNDKVQVIFEKVTGMDYRGHTYYSVKNLTMNECIAWCKEEIECKAAAFSFVINPFAPIQETRCQLQNQTSADNPMIYPQRAVSSYYFVKLYLRPETKNVCGRPVTFERVPNRMLPGHDDDHRYTSSKEACISACLNEEDFTCRSAEYNPYTLECKLSGSDRRTPGVNADLVEVAGIDYFENLCIQSNVACAGKRNYTKPQFGVPDIQVAQYVDLNFWIDKEVLATSQRACSRACQLETDFVCRSFLYKDPEPNQISNCQLYHVDHVMFPDGPATFVSNPPLPLIDNGQEYGTYYEMVCQGKATTPRPPPVSSSTTKATTSVTKSSRRPLPPINDATTEKTTPLVTSSVSPSRSGANSCDNFGVCYDVSVNCKDTSIDVQVAASKPFNGRIYALGRSETCNIDVRNKDEFSLQLTMNGQDCNTQSVGGVFTNTIVIQHHSVVITKTDKLYKVRCTYDISARNVTFGLMSIGDPQTINVTANPEAPQPHIIILGLDGRETAAVRIGDRLTFRIEIPRETPYGIFARSCYAMAKDSKSTFQIIDDRGCPTDPTIFPHFLQDGTALQSDYEAFRFTESYGVIFQCNVKYCLGPCEPVQCGSNGRQSEPSWGRRRRRSASADVDWQGHDLLQEGSDMTLSQEILVLDQDEEGPQALRTNPVVNETVRIEDHVTVIESCPSKSSVMALGVTCALLLVIYVCSAAFLFMRKWTMKSEKMNRM